MSLSEKSLLLKTLGRYSDLPKMNMITKVPAKLIDSTTFFIKPSRREFVKFLTIPDFGFQETYQKL